MCPTAMNAAAEFIRSMKNSSTCTSVEVHCSACAWPVLAIAIDHSMTLLNASPHPYENVSLKMEFTILDPPRHPHRYRCSWSNLMYVLVIGTRFLYLYIFIKGILSCLLSAWMRVWCSLEISRSLGLL